MFGSHQLTWLARLEADVDGDDNARGRSLSAMRRRQEKFRRSQMQETREKISREVVLPETITIQELSQRMSERAVDVIDGPVERFELPNLKALNFLLHESLGGGGTLSLMTDAQGKTFSTALLRMEIEISDDEARKLELH